MLVPYDPATTMRDARKVYFDANHFGDDGGYGDAWVDFKLGPIPFPFPNTASRVRAVRYHDVHHVLTGYDTNFVGELEISAWEIAAGCKGYAAAWVLNLSGLAGGLLRAPARTFAAFVRGRKSRTAYDEDLEALLDRTVGDLRATFVADHGRRATASDVAAFLVASVAAMVVGTVVFATMVPLAPLGLVMTWLRRRSLATAGA
jgi:hypothetical protein